MSFKDNYGYYYGYTEYQELKKLIYRIKNAGVKFNHSDWSNYSVQEIDVLELRKIHEILKDYKG